MRRPDGWLAWTIAGLVTVAAWVITVVSASSMSRAMPMPGGWSMSMAWMAMGNQSALERGAMFLGMWTVMMVAMMLPSVMPVVLLHGRLMTARLERGEAAASSNVLLLVGYFAVWSVFGAVAYAIGITITGAAAYWWPGAVHEGNGMVQLAIDEKATPGQRAALLAITSGKEGGTFFEIFAAVVSKAFDPIFAPITFQTDADKRVASLKVPGLGEFRAEPIKNPVTGEEFRGRIQLPGGFEYKVAEMGNCVMNSAKVVDKKLDNKNSYAQFCSVDWSNA